MVLSQESAVECSCYGCAIGRQRAGVRPPDRSADPCDPPSACLTHGRCWTHSEWINEAERDPPVVQRAARSLYQQ